MSGRKHRDKGNRVEREIVRLHSDIGVEAARVPLSGAAGGRFSGDIDLNPFGAEDITNEVRSDESGSARHENCLRAVSHLS